MENSGLRSEYSSMRKGGPPTFSLLSVGQRFQGTQCVSPFERDDVWGLEACILGCDIKHGYLCGTLKAIPASPAFTIETFWEGEIIDGTNYTFLTGKWEAEQDDDLKHWDRMPAFSPFATKAANDGGKGLDMSTYPFVFMRWKENYFKGIDIDSGFSMAGFYYLCFSCEDRIIKGFYYDPYTTPLQKVELRSRFSFSSYELL